MEELQGDGYLFADLNREDKIEVGKCLVPNAIADYLQFDKNKNPVKYRNGYTKYWDREQFENIPESVLKRFGELYLKSVEKGLDLIDIGNNLYELGIKKDLPGFIPKIE